MIDTVLLVAAAICFALAAFGVTLGGRVNLVALGLLFWVAASIFPV